MEGLPILLELFHEALSFDMVTLFEFDLPLESFVSFAPLGFISLLKDLELWVLSFSFLADLLRSFVLWIIADLLAILEELFKLGSFLFDFDFL